MRHNLPLSFNSFYHHKVIAFGNMIRKLFVVYPSVVAKVSGVFSVQAVHGVVVRLRRNGALQLGQNGVTVVHGAVPAHQPATLSACPALNSCTHVSRSFFIAVVKSSAFVDWPVVAGLAGAWPDTMAVPSTMTSMRRGEYEVRRIFCLLR